MTWRLEGCVRIMTKVNHTPWVSQKPLDPFRRNSFHLQSPIVSGFHSKAAKLLSERWPATQSTQLLPGTASSLVPKWTCTMRLGRRTSWKRADLSHEVSCCPTLQTLDILQWVSFYFFLWQRIVYHNIYNKNATNPDSDYLDLHWSQGDSVGRRICSQLAGEAAETFALVASGWGA